MSNKNYKLTNDTADKTNELPLVEGTMGPSAIDVRRLYKEQGIFTYDPGFGSTVS